MSVPVWVMVSVQVRPLDGRFSTTGAVTARFPVTVPSPPVMVPPPRHMPSPRHGAGAGAAVPVSR
ncbi:hypothetical protein GCM10023177_60890 [Streptomyces violaceoruber]